MPNSISYPQDEVAMSTPKECKFACKHGKHPHISYICPLCQLEIDGVIVKITCGDDGLIQTSMFWDALCATLGIQDGETRYYRFIEETS